MGKCKTILSAYTIYRHLEWYYAHPHQYISGKYGSMSASSTHIGIVAVCEGMHGRKSFTFF